MSHANGSMSLTPRYLEDCDGFLDFQFERGNRYGHVYGTHYVDPDASHWSKWPSIITHSGHRLYVHNLLNLPRHRLLPLLTNINYYSWFLAGITTDGRVVMVMRQHAGMPVVYAVGRPPWRRHNYNPLGCLRLGLLLVISWSLLFICAGVILSRC